MAAPARDDEALANFGALGFTGVAPEPEPQPAPTPEPVAAQAAPEPEHEHVASEPEPAPTAPPREEVTAAASRSEARQAAPEQDEVEAPAPVDDPQPVASPGSGVGEAAISWASNNLGLPYEWGSAGPGTYDCSGFTKTAFAAAGMQLPHGSEAQYHSTARVPLSQIQRGDLLFYSSNGAPSGIFHVAIYLGDGQVIHALRDRSAFDGSKINGINYASGLMAAGRP